MTMHAGSEAATSGLRVGVDLVMVGEVASSIEGLGDRYLSRLFTDHEIECSRGSAGAMAASLAARFAAKEAMLKVLEPVGQRPPWRSIEMRRDPGGGCRMALSGEAARLAGLAGISNIAVSVSHEALFAVAVVVAHVSPAYEGSYAESDEGTPVD